MPWPPPRIAHEIWHEHDAALIGPQQIDFMLAGRCTDEALGARE